MKRAIELEITELARRAVEATLGNELFLANPTIDVQVEVPRDRSHGDFATNVALALASVAKRSPRKLAEEIVAHLELNGATPVDTVEIAGPGFINFRLKPQWLHQVVRNILEQGRTYGNSASGQGQKVLLEFVSANPTGPLVVANARAAAVGDSLCRIMNAAGYVAASEYYINDAGNQVLNLGKTLETRCWQELGHDRELPPEAYPGEYVIDIARDFISERTAQAVMSLLEEDADQRPRRLGRYAVDAILKTQKESLRRYGVEFDAWYSEQAIRDAQGPQRVVKLLEDHGLTYKEEGATWLRSSQFGDDKDRVLVKSDGEYTYLVPDAAYHLNKFERGFEHLVNLWGPDHHGYIARMKAILEALGYRPEQLTVLIVQWVRLIRDGEVVKMSKRGGNFIAMDELLDEVGKDAARFFFLMRSPDTPMDFDLDLAKLETNENPVYYVQYAHARICSILREADERGVDVVPGEVPDLHVLTHEKEDMLMRQCAEFPGEVAAAARSLEPQRITAYARELATSFHGFYTECRVLTEDAELTEARLALCRATQTILRRTLELLGVSAPEQM